MPDKIKIGDIDSLKVTLSDGSNSATNELNDLGFLLHGNTEEEFNSLVKEGKTTFVSSSGATKTYTKDDWNADYNGNLDSIYTSFATWRSNDYDGINDATEESQFRAWNFDSTQDIDFKSDNLTVEAEFVYNEITYIIKEDN